MKDRRGDMPLPLTRLIHENFALLMMYAYSQPALTRLLETKFQGEWKYLNKALFGYPVEKFTETCHSTDPKRWKVAEIEMVALAAFCGKLMS
jgi:hypothetical protein